MQLLCVTAAKALSSPQETTLRLLLREYGLDDGHGLLNNLAQIALCLDEFQVSCSPPIGSQGLDEPRVLAAATKSPLSLALKEISGGETAAVEFKSSLVLDWKRYHSSPSEQISLLKNEEVTHSCLKTIAAFANTDGGTILIGVRDDATVCGLLEDYKAANSKRGDYDGWEQYLRNTVDTKFSDGVAVNSYVRTEQMIHDGLPFVRMTVAPRKTLTFLRKDQNVLLYTRSGTRTVSIKYEEIEKHFTVTRNF